MHLLELRFEKRATRRERKRVGGGGGKGSEGGEGVYSGEPLHSSVIVQLLALIKEVSIEKARGLHISDTQFYNNTHAGSGSQPAGIRRNPYPGSDHHVRYILY